MKISPLSMDSLFVIEPEIFTDERGCFYEIFRLGDFNEATGQNCSFVQDNFSLSEHVNTVRGLHFQSPPRAQGKLVSCVKGRILDVTVDIRKDSKTFRRHLATEISEENKLQLWIPPGFLHGYVTLEDNCEVIYKMTDYYAPEFDRSVLWNSPELGIDWGVDPASAKLSERDKFAPGFSDFESPFQSGFFSSCRTANLRN
ncbi:MAG: dTDP-4-dehydrorhamnose 3,5-epimerase [Hyphomonadaceae bacterium]|nr:dTDP-4-dehydrorhamnose 3,5-epimerase [Hyphomonadaceae bacterium]